eukprot:GHRQ01038436.1.p1 GENE.GHRQ01038436.1~~GHRQ01038436.1.p1  ORF type:complete len:125 (+),score=7.37 GHRQ01038436.1:300-674(+)
MLRLSHLLPHVKNGDPPSICTSFASPGARRNASTSEGVENCGSLVSNLVLTSTVRDRVGSTCGTQVRRYSSDIYAGQDQQHTPTRHVIVCTCVCVRTGHLALLMLAQQCSGKHMQVVWWTAWVC